MILEPTAAWRVCYVRPGDDGPPVLYSPSSTSAQPRFTGSRVFRAECAHHDRPPVSGCRCGIYSVENVIEALYRLKYMGDNIRKQDSGSWPDEIDDGMVPVLVRVIVYNALRGTAGGTEYVRFNGGRIERIEFVELRSETAVIQHLWVPRDDDLAPHAGTLAQRLADTFGVPTDVGYPSFSRADFDAMPPWLLTACSPGLPLKLDRPQEGVTVDGSAVSASMQDGDYAATDADRVWPLVNGWTFERLVHAANAASGGGAAKRKSPLITGSRSLGLQTQSASIRKYGHR